MNDWKKVKLGDVFVFNPQEKILKGSKAKKIAMEKIQPFTRNIKEYEIGTYLGGTKFRNGDTIMARITPCLENGKTAQVSILEENEVGFGSTEFIILRAKEGISDSNFVYYFTINPYFRNIAIKSMVGSTGRQRVQQGVILNLEISLPPLETQEKIAAILGCLDDKIEINNKINANLENQAQTIFKHYFVDNKEKENWKKIELGKIIKFNKGKKPLLINDKMEETNMPYLTIDAFSSNINSYAESNNMIIANEYDILMVMDGASAGKMYYGKNGIVASTFSKIDIDKRYIEVIYQFLSYYKDIIQQHNTGSAIPHVDKGFINNMILNLPDNIDCINNTFKIIRHNIIINQKENTIFAEIRDTLLPKLMNGEINV